MSGETWLWPGGQVAGLGSPPCVRATAWSFHVASIIDCRFLDGNKSGHLGAIAWRPVNKPKNKSTISAGMRRISEESMHQTFTIEGMSVRWNSSLEKISLSSRSQNKLSAVRNNAQDSRCLHLSVSPWMRLVNSFFPFSCAPRCKAG